MQASVDTIVWFPPHHVFLSQPLNLTSFTTLQVDGVLKSMATPLLEEWPQLPPLPSYNTSDDVGRYLQYQAFIYASHAHHIRILGAGEIDGSGDWWWDVIASHDRSILQAGRPNLIQFVNCQYIEIAYVTLRDSPFWCLHPVYCQHVHIHHMFIRTRTYAINSDGIDPDSCQNVMIENNDVGCGDDHIAIKAGRCGSPTQEHLSCAADHRFRDGIFATDNVTIRNNIFRNGMGIAVGSEMSGSIRNVDIYDNVIGVCQPGGTCKDDSCCGWGPALHIKTTLARGGVLENISFRNNTVYNTTSFILLNLHYQTKDDDMPVGYDATQIRNISFINNRALGSATSAQWQCSEQSVCREITVTGNYIANAKVDVNHTPWSCRSIASFTVSGNYPEGLEDCMKESMTPDAAWFAATSII
jgi:polygalacturonase